MPRLRQEVYRWADLRGALRDSAIRRLRAAWVAVEGTGGWVDIEILGTAALRLYGDGILGRYICCSAFEAPEVYFVHRFLRRGDVFVDVGANIGLFTVLAGRRVGSTGQVISFEPGSAARKRLVENVALNRLANATILPVALSSEESRAILSVPPRGMDAFGSLATPIAGEVPVSEEVRVAPWDSLADQLLEGRAVSMMKIDVEGWEPQVLMGAAKLLRPAKAPLLQVEFTDAAAESAGAVCADLYALLVEYGFQVCRYEASENRLVPEAVRGSYPYVNLYATKDLSGVNRRLSGKWPRWGTEFVRTDAPYRVVEIQQRPAGEVSG